MGRRPATVALLPREPGVYRFRDAGGTVLYLGRALDLRRRVASYWGDLRDRPHLRRMITRVDRIEALVCASEHEAAWAERTLLEHRLPRWNRTAGGQESPLLIALDAGPARPGLSAVFTAGTRPGVRYFGPYLGNRRARLAVSGLLRAFPLAYTGTAITPSERELAGLRGVRTDQLAEVVAGLVAVLEREPAAVAAVLAELEQRRDRAAAELQYELAGQLQEEAEALRWAVAPQSVCTHDGGDADPCGWAGGVRVALRIRGGRLVGWEQQPSDGPGSGTSGPPEWAAFARRNAELAATLSGRVVAG
jgi:excinuclease UvrABC nuclease subunit